MARRPRVSVGNTCYHVFNRGNGRRTVFHKDGDYVAFLKLMKQASHRIPMRFLSFCLMPNHFHFVLWPRHDGDLSRWMQWLTTSHVRRYHRHYASSGMSGKVDSSRFRFSLRSIVDGHALRGTQSGAGQVHSGSQGAELEMVFRGHSAKQSRSRN